MNCIIVDDEELAIKVLENHISKIDTLHIVATCKNAMEAFSRIQREKVDLLFLDIQMPKLSGFGLLKSLPQAPHVVITTAHREFALESYEFTIADYLLKPISFERFLKAISKIHYLDQLKAPVVSSFSEPITQENNQAFFYIQSDRQFVKILLKEVLFIESHRNHVRILTSTGNYITLKSISEMERKLPPQHFIRIHRSYIVNLSKINQFTHSNIQVGDKTLPIGSMYKNEVVKRLSKDLF